VTRSRPLFIALALLLLPGGLPAEQPLYLAGLPVEDRPTREVVEEYTLARQLKTVRVIGTLKITNWVLDRPPFAATLARHLHPPLERYHITEQRHGVYAVDDRGSLRGSVRLVARASERRVYLVEGQFRSLAHLLNLSGSMVFALTVRERWEGNESIVEIDPQLYVRLHHILAHRILKILAPLIHGVIDRRVDSLTVAAQVVSQRLTQDPRGLYREIRTWPDVGPAELEEYRQAFRILENGGKGGG
jgi:hypothetical protein